jgi:hypothetical protein
MNVVYDAIWLDVLGQVLICDCEIQIESVLYSTRFSRFLLNPSSLNQASFECWEAILQVKITLLLNFILDSFSQIGLTLFVNNLRLKSVRLLN